MSVLAKGRVFLIMSPDISKEKSDEILHSIHAKPFGRFFKYVDLGELIPGMGLIYSCFYGTDETDEYWRRGLEIYEKVDEFSKNIKILSAYEQGDFLVPEWHIPRLINKEGIILRWEPDLDVSFVIYQLTFITKPWKEHLTSLLETFSNQEKHVFYSKVWNNYITYVLAVNVEGKGDVEFSRDFGDKLLGFLMKHKPEGKTVTPPKKDLEIFYRDYDSVILSGIGSSTSWGIIVNKQGVTHLSLHYYGDGFSVMKEPVDD